MHVNQGPQEMNQLNPLSPFQDSQMDVAAYSGGAYAFTRLQENSILKKEDLNQEKGKLIKSFWYRRTDIVTYRGAEGNHKRFPWVHWDIGKVREKNKDLNQEIKKF